MSTYTDASLIVKPNSKKAGKLYTLKGADLDVVRATTATYVGSDGLIKIALANEPRFDYTNGSCPSILVEPQRTNLALRSEEFDNSSWAKLNATVIANSTISPNGGLNADTITSNLTTGFISQGTSAVIGTTYTLSIYIKNINASSSAFLGRTTLNNYSFGINWSGQTISSITSLIGTTSYTSVGNGWYRIVCVFNSLEASIGNRIYSDNTTINKSVSVWGAQLEVGANATSYIPTVASSVTRNADVISKTGISDLIGQTDGTMYVEIAPLTIESTSRDIEISDGNTNRVIIQFNSTGIGAFVIVGGVVQASFSFNNLDTNFKKVALKYKVNDFSLFVDGVKVAFDTSGTTFPLNTLTRLDFKKVTPSSLEYYGKVKSLCLWKTALTDAECIALTTL